MTHYAIVCYQEMGEDKINKAPELEAGSEVMRVYSNPIIIIITKGEIVSIATDKTILNILVVLIYHVLMI